jgi:hypothetical protein
MVAGREGGAIGAEVAYAHPPRDPSDGGNVNSVTKGPAAFMFESG